MKQEYEYLVESIQDEWKGGANIHKLQELLNRRAEDGWKLSSAITNELGKNAMSSNGFGVNATLDQTILIFERPYRKYIESFTSHMKYDNSYNKYSKVKIDKIEIEKNELNKTAYISVIGKLNKNINLSSIKVNMVFESFWGESRNECVIFDKIDVNSVYGFKTEYVSIDESILKSLKSINAMVVQYVEGNVMYENNGIEQDTITDIVDSNTSFTEQYLDLIDNLPSVRAIRDYLTDQNIKSEVYINTILPKMDEFIVKERLYGSLTESFIKWLKENHF